MTKTNRNSSKTAFDSAGFAGNLNISPQFGGSFSGVKPTLREALEMAAYGSPNYVEAASGQEPHGYWGKDGKWHETPNHRLGYAMDVGLYDPVTGELLDNGSNLSTAATYAKYGRLANAAMSQVAPGTPFRAGVNFTNQDNMHYDQTPRQPQGSRAKSKSNPDGYDIKSLPDLGYGSYLDAFAAQSALNNRLHPEYSADLYAPGYSPFETAKPKPSLGMGDLDLLSPKDFSTFGSVPSATSFTPAFGPLTQYGVQPAAASVPERPPARVEGGIYGPLSSVRAPATFGAGIPGSVTFGGSLAPPVSPDIGGGAPTQGDYRAAPVRDVTNSTAYNPGVPTSGQQPFGPMSTASPSSPFGAYSPAANTNADRAAAQLQANSVGASAPMQLGTAAVEGARQAYKTVSVPNPAYANWTQAMKAQAYDPDTLGLANFNGVPSLAGDLTAGTVVPGDWNKAFPTTTVAKPVFGQAPPKTITKQIPIAAPAVPAAIPTPPPRPPEISQPMSLGQQLSHALGFGGNGGGQVATGGGISGFGVTPGGLVAGVNRTEYSRGGAAGNMGGGYRTSNEGGNLHG